MNTEIFYREHKVGAVLDVKSDMCYCWGKWSTHDSPVTCGFEEFLRKNTLKEWYARRAGKPIQFGEGKKRFWGIAIMIDGDGCFYYRVVRSKKTEAYLLNGKKLDKQSAAANPPMANR